jgi:hypothetical protein
LNLINIRDYNEEEKMEEEKEGKKEEEPKESSDLDDTSSLQSSQNFIPQCAVCLEEYNHEANEPLCLHCGHSLCKKCVTKLY